MQNSPHHRDGGMQYLFLSIIHLKY